MIKNASTELVRPGDIEAVDGADLLSQMLEQSLSNVKDVNDTRLRQKWVADKTARIRLDYYNKAKATYEKIWRECGQSAVGHNNLMIDVRGQNVNECTVCLYHQSSYPPSNSISGRRDYDSSYNRAQSANDDLITILSNRMIALDEKAGILTWPTEDMAPSPKKHVGSPKQPIISRLWR